MKKDDLKSLKSKSVSELQSELLKSQQELNSLRLDLKAQKLKDVHAPFKTRKKIAVIKTLITQKQSSKNNQPQAAKKS